MRFNKYLNENLNENFVVDVVKKISNKTSSFVLKLFKTSFENFTKVIKQENIEDEVLKILNKHSKKNYKDLDQIINSKPQVNENLNEDFKHYWQLIKSETFPALSFYPALSVWMEIDKLIKNIPNVEANFKIITVYSIFWFLLISGKFVKEFYKWKKENPKEYEKERKK